MATIAAVLPTLGTAVAETSSSTAVITAGLPALTANVSSGVPVAPPSLRGTAVLRALAGTATAT